MTFIAQSTLSDYNSGGSLADLWTGDGDYLEDYLKI